MHVNIRGEFGIMMPVLYKMQHILEIFVDESQSLENTASEVHIEYYRFKNIFSD
jgi:hypothetical protein